MEESFIAGRNYTRVKEGVLTGRVESPSRLELDSASRVMAGMLNKGVAGVIH